MRNTASLLLSLVLCLGLLAGCGSAGSPSSSEAAREPSPSSEAAPESPASEPDSEPVSEAPEETPADLTLPETVWVAALKGPTAMGMVKLMQDSEDGAAQLSYDFTITTTDDIVPKITKGEIDIAAVPANLASVLYNNTGGRFRCWRSTPSAYYMWWKRGRPFIRWRI